LPELFASVPLLVPVPLLLFASEPLLLGALAPGAPVALFVFVNEPVPLYVLLRPG